MTPTSKSRLIEIISNFKGLPIAVAGDMILDRFIWGRVERISPEAPVPVIEITKETVHLGGAANVASNLVSLGARPVPLGVIGTDEAGRALQDEFARLGIDAQGVISQESRVTTVKTRIIAHHQQVCRADRETRTPVVGETLKELLAIGADIVPRCSAVILSDYLKGLLVAPLVDCLVESSRRRNMFLAVDPKADDFCIYRGASIITPNKREAERASGLSISDDQSLVSAGNRLLERTGAAHILITRGEEGMTLIEKGHHFHLPTLAREVFDVTGAGDTVIATLTLAVAAGATVREAAHLANHAAGIVVGKVGTAAATAEELRASLENHGG
ncbi:MAG: D-glycero-beta-D-manno-heptose-7-phosphate kinase [Acidobacteriota bacterium]